ncbi:RING/U-box superfamily protein, partial [Striga asiatica]
TLRDFLGAKLMTLRMINLEYLIEKFRDLDDIGNEELNSIIKKHLQEKEEANWRNKEPCILDYLRKWFYVDEFLEGTSVASPNYCEHEYHTTCLLRWLYDHRFCPFRSLALSPKAEYPSWIKDVGKVRTFLFRASWTIPIDNLW